MHIEYKIKYKIDGDIPINPDWIRGQLQEGVDKLNKKLKAKKNLNGDHKLVIKLPDGWALPIKN